VLVNLRFTSSKRQKVSIPGLRQKRQVWSKGMKATLCTRSWRWLLMNLKGFHQFFCLFKSSLCWYRTTTLSCARHTCQHDNTKHTHEKIAVQDNQARNVQRIYVCTKMLVIGERLRLNWLFRSIRLHKKKKAPQHE